ncbi:MULTISPECIES: organic hydroperoxide resistance protein [Virgibacillus]|nr:MULTISPECIES: organic hydroperoxide resistance protein [Virgibacillus]MYL41155.1 Ohr family peroxiredoxin [Virgibacillus massiliensis]
MMKPMFTTTVSSVGGRNGKIVSSDGRLEHDIAMPGTAKAKEKPEATNPEQLFAAGYAACFGSALEMTANQQKIDLDSEVIAHVSMYKDEKDNGFKLGVKLEVIGTGITQTTLDNLVEKAHHVCPYSKATTGNVEVELITSVK